MITNFRLSDLPEKCADLVESLELISVAETLSGTDMKFSNFEDSWNVYIKGLDYALVIPKNLSEFSPASTVIEKSALIKATDLIAFEREITDVGILIRKIEPRRGFGYINMGGYSNKPIRRWEFVFLKQKTFYDFYLICKKYNLF